jgi:triphosphatase
MADDHRIDGLTAELPVAEAARLALTVRLHPVRERLASLESGERAIHDLRVASRRAQSTVDAFRICIKRKAAKRAKSALRAIRRAAGSMRDWDVLFTLLRSTNAPSSEFLQGYLSGRREAASERFNETMVGLRQEALKLCEQLPRRVRRPSAEAIRRFRDLTPSFASRLVNLDRALRKLPPNPEKYHPLRINIKRLRYAMEVFAPCFGPQLMDRVYPQVEAMQRHLGEFRDADMAIERLESLETTVPSAIDSVLSELRAKRRHAEDEFEACRESWKLGEDLLGNRS